MSAIGAPNLVVLDFLLHPGKGAEYCDPFVCLCVCLFVCLSVREYIFGTTRPIFTDYLCRSTVAMATSFPGGFAIRYVLPVLWMASPLAVGAVWRCVAIPGLSLTSMNALLSLALFAKTGSYDDFTDCYVVGVSILMCNSCLCLQSTYFAVTSFETLL